MKRLPLSSSVYIVPPRGELAVRSLLAELTARAVTPPELPMSNEYDRFYFIRCLDDIRPFYPGPSDKENQCL